MLSRRQLFVCAGGVLLSQGCKRVAAQPASCDDTATLSADERTARTTLGYADRSPDPNKACRACQQWVVAARDGGCGSCKLLKGPIHPEGTCKAFALKG
jgi:hypothetical protein